MAIALVLEVGRTIVNNALIKIFIETDQNLVAVYPLTIINIVADVNTTM